MTETIATRCQCVGRRTAAAPHSTHCDQFAPIPAPPADRVPTRRVAGCEYCDRYSRACGRHESTETINATKGLSFHLADIHGFVTGVVYGDECVEVIAKAVRHDAEDGARYRMAHLRCGNKVADRAYGTDYAVESWDWITRDDFDRIVDMEAMRLSLGWRD